MDAVAMAGGIRTDEDDALFRLILAFKAALELGHKLRGGHLREIHGGHQGREYTRKREARRGRWLKCTLYPLLK